VGRWAQLVGSAAVVAGCVAVLAQVRTGSLDAADGVVLIAALIVFARALIRLASESPDRRQGRNGV
jgi:hypothetical protein